MALPTNASHGRETLVAHGARGCDGSALVDGSAAMITTRPDPAAFCNATLYGPHTRLSQGRQP